MLRITEMPFPLDVCYSGLTAIFAAANISFFLSHICESLPAVTLDSA